MKPQGDEIENLFRKGLGGYESEPDGHVWEAIQKGVKKARRKFLWKIILPSVFLVAALGAAGVWYSQMRHDSAITDTTRQEQEKVYGGYNAEHQRGLENTGEGNLTNPQGQEVIKGYNNNAGLQRKWPTQKNNKKKTENAIPGGDAASQDEENTRLNSLTDTVPAVVENDLFDTDTAVEETVKKDTIRSRSASNEKNKPVLTRRFMVSAYTKPVWTPLPRMLDNRVLPKFIEEKNINLKMAAGLGMQYQVGKRLFVSAGFEYFRAEQDLNYTTYKYMQNSKMVKTISTDRKVQQEILRWETLVPDKRHTFTKVFECFNYPLHAAYSVYATEKFNVTATGGVALSRLRWKSYDITDSTYYTGVADEQVQKRQYLSVSVGAGVNYFVNSRFTAFINPVYGFLGKDLSQKRRGYGPRNQYYSVSAGIGFKF